MARGSRSDTRGKDQPGKPDAGVPLDLGLTLSVYGTNPQGRLIEIRDGARMTGDALPDTWPTEQ